MKVDTIDGASQMLVELVVATPDADLLVVNAARASFGKESELECVEPACYDGTGNYYAGKYALASKDARLINYLAREKHVLPFRHPHITLRCKAPLFVARQLMKHQVGMSWSEESRRYIDSEPEFYFPDAWRKRADNVKQGSSDEVLHNLPKVFIPLECLDDGDGVVYGHASVVELGGRAYTPQHLDAYSLVKFAHGYYELLLAEGVAPELARIILPQNMYTTWVWTGSLLSWHHMLTLRLDEHTQKETRDFAKMVRDVVTPIAPVSMEALNTYGQ